MKRRTRMLLLAVISIGVLVMGIGYVAYINSPHGIIARGNPNAGLWEDDPKNWNRAFHSDPPAGLTVVHSKYWESDHFTHEYIYFFEVKAPREWQESFLKERGLEPVAPSNAWGFQRSCTNLTPDWFAPGPVESYYVWDRPKYHGSIWINRIDGHIHFYGVQL